MKRLDERKVSTQMGMKVSKKKVRIQMKKGMVTMMNMIMRALMDNLKETRMMMTFMGIEREVRSQMGTSVFMERWVNIWNRMSTLAEKEKTAGVTLHRSRMGTSIFMEG